MVDNTTNQKPNTQKKMEEEIETKFYEAFLSITEYVDAISLGLNIPNHIISNLRYVAKHGSGRLKIKSLQFLAVIAAGKNSREMVKENEGCSLKNFEKLKDKESICH